MRVLVAAGVLQEGQDNQPRLVEPAHFLAVDPRAVITLPDVTFICTQDHDQRQRSLRGSGCHGA